MIKYIIQIEDAAYKDLWHDYDEHDNQVDAIYWLDKTRKIRSEMKSDAKFRLVEREEIIRQKVLPY